MIFFYFSMLFEAAFKKIILKEIWIVRVSNFKLLSQSYETQEQKYRCLIQVNTKRGSEPRLDEAFRGRD